MRDDQKYGPPEVGMLLHTSAMAIPTIIVKKANGIINDEPNGSWKVKGVRLTDYDPAPDHYFTGTYKSQPSVLLSLFG